jgi:hypothetical protein
MTASLGVNNTISKITVPPTNGSAVIGIGRTTINYTPNAGCVLWVPHVHDDAAASQFLLADCSA